MDHQTIIDYARKHWTMIAGVSATIVGIFSVLSANSWFNGPVHASEFLIFKQRIDDHEKVDNERWQELKDDLKEIRSDVKFIIRLQKPYQLP